MPATLDQVSTSTAARLLGVSENRVRQLAAAGRLPYTETVLGKLFDRQTVEQLAERRRQGDVP